MDDDHPVAVHIQVSTAWIDDVKPFAFLLSNIAEPQIVGIQKLNDMALYRHSKI
jgi:hypothetical protein